MQCRSEPAQFHSELTAFLFRSYSGQERGNEINDGTKGWDDQEDNGDQAS